LLWDRSYNRLLLDRFLKPIFRKAHCCSQNNAKEKRKEKRVVEFNEELTGIAGHGCLSVAYVGVEPCRLLSLGLIFGVGQATITTILSSITISNCSRKNRKL
jgi:hypothetical protein